MPGERAPLIFAIERDLANADVRSYRLWEESPLTSTFIWNRCVVVPRNRW